MIPLCEPLLNGHEWTYIKECLDTNWISSAGKYVDRFEQEVAARTGAAQAVAVSSGTAALHLALLAVGVQPGDAVLVSSLTFIASANAVAHCGAFPLFVDAEPEYWQMDPAGVQDILRHSVPGAAGPVDRRTGRRIAAIVPVHLLGHPVDLNPILAIARDYHVPVVEDACEALGAKYRGRAAGTFGDLGCLSFNGNKLITTGGGGMVLTNNAEYAQRVRHISTQARASTTEYIHDAVGYNYRMTNIAAAMGCAQLEQLDRYIQTKCRIAERYNNAFAAQPGIEPMREADWADSTWWMYTIRVLPETFGLSARELSAHLREQGIATRCLWEPLHRSRAFPNCSAWRGETAERLFNQCLSLPCSVSLSEANQSRVIQTITAGEKE